MRSSSPAGRRSKRDLATAERERLEHPRQAEVVVGVVVRQEDLLEVDEPHVAAQELALRPLGTVDEEPLAAAPDERRGQRTTGRRHRARRPEEDDVELHGGRLYSGAQSRPCVSRYSLHAAPFTLQSVRSRTSPDAAPGFPRRIRSDPRRRRRRALVTALARSARGLSRRHRRRHDDLCGRRSRTAPRPRQRSQGDAAQAASPRANARAPGRHAWTERLRTRRPARVLDDPPRPHRSPPFEPGTQRPSSPRTSRGPLSSIPRAARPRSSGCGRPCTAPRGVRWARPRPRSTRPS